MVDASGRRVRLSAYAHLYAQAVTIATQLAGVPLFLKFWPIDQYGRWLVLSAVAVYISLADFGFLQAISNRLTQLLEQGGGSELTLAVRRGFTLTCSVLLTLLMVLAVAAWLLVAFHALSIHEGRALFWLGASSSLALLCGFLEAVHKAGGTYARATVLLTTTRIFEWAGALLGAAIGGLAEAALGYCCGRLVGTVIIGWSTRVLYDWFDFRFDRELRREREALGSSAIAFFFFPVGGLLTVQGLTIVAGSLLGPASAAALTTFRTLSRVVVQVPTLVSKSLMPELARALASNQKRESIQLLLKFSRLSLALSLIFSVVIFFGSPWLVALLSHGQIAPNRSLIAVLLAAAIFSSVTQVVFSYLGASEQHKRFAVAYGSAALATILGYVCVAGPTGTIGLVCTYATFEAVIAVIGAYQLREALKTK